MVARAAVDRVEREILHALTDAIPALDFQTLGADPCDWDGWSLELYGVTPVGLTLDDAQLEAVWALGFTVVRLYYEGENGEELRDGRSGSMSGDFWRVKGLPAGQCRCSK